MHTGTCDYVLTTNLKMAVSRHLAQYNLIDTDRGLRGILMLEAVGSSETSVSIYKTKWRYIPGNNCLQS
jgi:hypothetical protein